MRLTFCIAISFLFISADALAEQVGTRVLHFPNEHAVGRLKVRDVNSENSSYQNMLSLPHWELLGQAQGDMIVPAGKVLKLEVYSDIIDISFLSQLESNDLAALSLDRTNILDEDLVHLKRLTGLQALGLGSTNQVDGSGLVHLTGLQSLKELSLFHCQISDTALVHISRLKALERLTLHWTQIEGSGLVHLSDLTSLKNLVLAKTLITNESLSHLQNMTWLKELDLYDTEIGDLGLSYLRGLLSLERLSLGNIDRSFGISPITDSGMTHLKALTALKDLRLYRTHITDAGFAHLSNLTALEGLDLTDSKITGKGLGQLSRLSPLRWIGLNNTYVTGSGIVNLKSWATTLEDLQLRDTPISDVDLSHLVSQKKLKWLTLSNTGITDAGLIYLSRIESLESLYLDNTRITDSGLMALRDLPNLSRISVMNTGVTNEGLERFKQTSASKSITSNVRRRLISTKKKGLTTVVHQSPQQAKPQSLAGKQIPTIEGIKIDFELERAKGRSLLLCFFDLDQRPSRYCVSQLVKQTEQLKNKGVTVVAIQASKVDEKALAGWMSEHNISFPVGVIPGDVEKTKLTWNVRSLPWLILTDREHIVRAEGFTLAELDEKLKANK